MKKKTIGLLILASLTSAFVATSCGPKEVVQSTSEGGITPVTTSETPATTSQKPQTSDAVTSNGGGSSVVQINYGELIAQVDPTCEADGKKAHYHADNGKFYDADKKEVSEESLIIAKLGHDLVHHDLVPATALKDGVKEYYECSRCHELFLDADAKTKVTEADLVIPALGYEYDTAVIAWTGEVDELGVPTAKATLSVKDDTEGIPTKDVDAIVKVIDSKEVSCEEDGYTVYEASYVIGETTFKADATKTITVTKLGHDYSVEYVYGEGKAYEVKTCSICNDVVKTEVSIVDAKDVTDAHLGEHIFVKGVIKDVTSTNIYFEDSEFQLYLSNRNGFTFVPGDTLIAEGTVKAYTKGDVTINEFERGNILGVEAGKVTFSYDTEAIEVTGLTDILTSAKDVKFGVTVKDPTLKIATLKVDGKTLIAGEDGLYSISEFSSNKVSIEVNLIDKCLAYKNGFTKLEQIQSGKIVIGTSYDGNFYIISPESPSKGTGIAIKITEEELFKTSDDYAWDVEVDGKTAYLSTSISGKKYYLTMGTSTKSLELVEKKVGFTISENTLKVGARYLSLFDGKDWRSYDDKNAKNKALDFYLYEDGFVSEHHMVRTDALAPTCEVAGHKAYYTCSECGRIYEDEAGTKQITDLDAWLAEGGDGYIAPTGHTYKVEFIWSGKDSVAVKVTCEQNDYEENITDGLEIKSRVTKNPTCEEKGEREFYVEFTYKEVLYTSTCPEKEEIAALEHKWGAWELGTLVKPTATSEGSVVRTCENDSSHKDTKVLPVLSSEAYDIVHTKDATCTETGIDTYTLKEDSTIKFEVVTDKIAHSTEKHDAVAPTCEAAGHKEYYECSVCHEYFEDAEGTIAIADLDAWLKEGGNGYIAPKGHTYEKHDAVAPTCTEDGNIEYFTCKDCGKVFILVNDEYVETTLADTVVDALGHDYEVKVVWTSKDEVVVKAVCSRGDHEEIIESKITSEVTKNATCGADGERTYYVEYTYGGKDCKEPYSVKEVIPALGHKYAYVDGGTWAADGKSLEITLVCANDSSDTLPVTLTTEESEYGVITIDGRVSTATIKANGETKTVTFTRLKNDGEAEEEVKTFISAIETSLVTDYTLPTKVIVEDYYAEGNTEISLVWSLEGTEVSVVSYAAPVLEDTEVVYAVKAMHGETSLYSGEVKFVLKAKLVSSSVTSEFGTVTLDDGSAVPANLVVGKEYSFKVIADETHIATGVTIEGYEANLVNDVVTITVAEDKPVSLVVAYTDEVVLDLTGVSENAIVMYEVNGETVISPSKLKIGSKFSITATGNDGYIVDEIKINGEKFTSSEYTVGKEDVAVVVTVIEAYTVLFNRNDGSNDVTKVEGVKKGAFIEDKSENMTRAGFNFVGWFLGTDGEHLEENPFDFANTPITENITLYAKWEAIPAQD